MLLGQTLQNISNTVLIYPFGLIMLAGMILSIKSGFIQIRAIKHMILTLWRSATKKEKEGSQTIAAHKALFIAMSTTIGIGNIVGPIIAIGLGGPGALAGFIVGTIFGSAVTFSEVFLAISYRKRRDDGSIAGGPMTYLSEVFGNAWAKFYAYAGFILLIAWSSNQSNTLAVLLASRGVSPYATGIILAITVTIVLIGGVKRIGNFSAKLVPAMFIIYCVAMFWILGCHIHQVPAALKLIFTSLWNPQSAIGATAGFGMAQAVRWGVARAVQINEIGTGTSTFPHSMAETNSPTDQGILSIAAVYTNGFL
ncbi:sodium:alanine symporter family protein, partial [bacterium]|nr:sodium:alanine symporter family protein [bacterium]